MENNCITADIGEKAGEKSPNSSRIVSVRLRDTAVSELVNATGERTPGLAVKKAALEWLFAKTKVSEQLNKKWGEG